MDQELVLIAILKKNEYTGFTVQPYLYQPENQNYIAPLERLTSLNVNTIENLPPQARELFEISELVEPLFIMKQFSKKKLIIKEFFDQKNNQFTEVIKPYLDRKLNDLITLLIKHDVPLYDASALPHLYPTDRIILVKGNADVKLNFDRTDEGTVYSLEVYTGKRKINLQNKTNYLLTYQPCHLISNNRLITFDRNINGKLLLPFFSKDNIIIPKRLEDKYFSTFIRKLVNNSEITATGFEVQDISYLPQAELTFELDWQGEYCLVLKYKYGDKTILANNTQSSFTELSTSQEGFIFYRSKRDKSWEEEKKGFLKESGLTLNGNCFKLPNVSEPHKPYSFINWLEKNISKLRENGFNITQDFSRPFFFGNYEIQTGLNEGIDWFDVRISVLIGQFTIPFIKFKNHILSQIREYELPDHSIFIIPDEWFAQYTDLFIHSELLGDQIRLRKHHYKILNKLQLIDDAEIESSEVVSDYTLPELNNVTLRPYQIGGYHWLMHLSSMGFGAILADDMGLGKTLQTIAVLATYYKEKYSLNTDGANSINSFKINDGYSTYTSSKKSLKPVNKTNSALSNPIAEQLDLFNAPPILEKKEATPKKQIETISKLCSLLVMPASLIHNWISEIKRFAPYLNAFVYTGIGRKKTKTIFKSHDLLLTTYGTLRNDIDFLSQYKFEYVILDESQQIKNPESKTAQAVFEIKANHRFALTGTPVENSLTDLWSQMHFANPGLLGSLNTFNHYYAAPLLKDPESPQREKLLSMIEPFILRRTKESVAPELPKLSETVSYCTMTDEQRELYESEKSKVRNLVLEQIDKGNISTSPVMVLKALMQLRQIANHPKMIDHDSSIESGKFEEVTGKLDTIVAENHRVLIFSSFVRHLKIFEEYCKANRFEYTLLTGASTNRGKIISEFKENEKNKIFLISLKAGGLGLNLTEADYVFILDPWWNPAAEMQAVNRAHRIGQNKNVFVYRFITKDSIEEKIQTLQIKKKALADAFIKPQNAIAGMTREEIMQLFE